MNSTAIDKETFFWVLQGVCALQRKAFPIDLARQQVPPPYTPDALAGAVSEHCQTVPALLLQADSAHVLFTLVPKGEQLFADVSIKNEDVGFVQVGQSAQIKLAAYPFQKYGMLTGKVARVSADATESSRPNGPPNASNDSSTWEGTSMAGQATYKARVQLDAQVLRDPRGESLALTPGMQVVAEINQGKRTVLEYLLSPVQKAVNEAGRER